jgi:hypothetical protein
MFHVARLVETRVVSKNQSVCFRKGSLVNAHYYSRNTWIAERPRLVGQSDHGPWILERALS